MAPDVGVEPEPVPELEERIGDGIKERLRDDAGLSETDAVIETDRFTALGVTWRRGDKFGAKFREPVSIERCGWSRLTEHAVLARLRGAGLQRLNETTALALVNGRLYVAEEHPCRHSVAPNGICLACDKPTGLLEAVADTGQAEYVEKARRA